MIRRRSLALAIALTLCVSCGRDAGHARSDLAKMNYQFTAEEFVRAARAGDEKAVKLFIDGGMAINSATSSGTTALIGAAENNAAGVIKTLTKQGADTDQKDKEGWTPLMKAIYGNKVEAIELLAGDSKEDLNRGLLLASLLGHAEAATILLKNGAEVDTASPEGSTSLTYARNAGNKALEKLLLEAGAEPISTNAAVAATSPTPNLADREGLLKDLKTMRNSSEEAWWRKYGLDLNDVGIFTKDSDDDGFTNSEEFLSDTSPIDPSSHPPAASKLTWQSYHRENVPYSLDKVENDVGILQDESGKTVSAKKGDAVGDYQVVAVRTRKSYDKDGNPYDGSDVVIEDKTGQKVRLVPGISGPASGSYASVKVPLSDELQHLRAGEEFNLPNDGKRRYIVLDLRENQVVIKETKTGETFTISSR